MKRELWNQGLMYLIVSLMVFLALPLATTRRPVAPVTVEI